jgi:hypothetical protein
MNRMATSRLNQVYTIASIVGQKPCRLMRFSSALRFLAEVPASLRRVVFQLGAVH